MSDTQGNTPDETPAADQAASVPETTPVAPPTPAAPTPTPAPAAADTTAVAPTLPVPPAFPAHAAAAIPPVPPVPPQAAPAYAAAAQPEHPKAVQPAYAGQQYTGQQYAGQAFGVPPQPAPGAAAPKPKKQKSGVSAGAVVGILVAAAFVGGAAGVGGAYAGSEIWGNQTNTSQSAPAAVTVNNPKSVTNTTAVATKVLPSTVTIHASSGQAGGTGSGVILSADGYILTNTHVVTLDGATGNPTLSVTTSDGHVYSATVVGTDPTYDLAVIKLKDAKGLTPIEFGDSSKINVGDQTLAIGAPLDLSNTVTTGIVSALNRSIEIASSAAPDSNSQDGTNGNGNGNGDNGQAPYQFDYGQGQQQTQAKDTIKIAVIQTDAAINPGNSGGALVDADGKLVGINVAIASAGSSSGGGQSGSIGVGFSIPSDIAKRVSDEIIKTGKATHGLLGASVGDAASAEGATTTGALVDAVTPGGAADKGGIQKGDVITAFNDVPITSSVDLTAQVRAQAAGSKATVTYTRDGKTHTATVTLGELKTN